MIRRFIRYYRIQRRHGHGVRYSAWVAWQIGVRQ